jgi:hypothetical protein
MTQAKFLTPTVQHTFFIFLSFFFFQSSFNILIFLLIQLRVIIFILIPLLQPIHVPSLFTPFTKNYLLVCRSPTWNSGVSGLSYQFGNPHILKLIIVFLSHSRLMLVYFLKIQVQGLLEFPIYHLPPTTDAAGCSLRFWQPRYINQEQRSFFTFVVLATKLRLNTRRILDLCLTINTAVND